MCMCARYKRASVVSRVRSRLSGGRFFFLKFFSRLRKNTLFGNFVLNARARSVYVVAYEGYTVFVEYSLSVYANFMGQLLHVGFISMGRGKMWDRENFF